MTASPAGRVLAATHGSGRHGVPECAIGQALVAPRGRGQHALGCTTGQPRAAAGTEQVRWQVGRAVAA